MQAVKGKQASLALSMHWNNNNNKNWMQEKKYKQEEAQYKC